MFAAGPGGGPHVRVLSGKDQSELRSFFAFDATFTGGINIASGDLNGDGYEDIIVGQASNGIQVRAFSGRDQSMMADYSNNFGIPALGLRVSSADVNHDGLADVVTSASDANHSVVLVRVGTASNTFSGGVSIYDPGFLGGVYVGV
jgi:hypothetical protein